jgi:hypothetical protein
MTRADLLCVESLAVYAAPVSTEAGLAVAKRCYGEGCKSVVVVSTFFSPFLCMYAHDFCRPQPPAIIPIILRRRS